MSQPGAVKLGGLGKWPGGGGNVRCVSMYDVKLHASERERMSSMKVALSEKTSSQYLTYGAMMTMSM